jgi:hypothetical protein
VPRDRRRARLFLLAASGGRGSTVVIDDACGCIRDVFLLAATGGRGSTVVIDDACGCIRDRTAVGWIRHVA